MISYIKLNMKTGIYLNLKQTKRKKKKKSLKNYGRRLRNQMKNQTSNYYIANKNRDREIYVICVMLL